MVDGPNIVIGGHGVEQGYTPKRRSSGGVAERWTGITSKESDDLVIGSIRRDPLLNRYPSRTQVKESTSEALSPTKQSPTRFVKTAEPYPVSASPKDEVEVSPAPVKSSPPTKELEIVRSSDAIKEEAAATSPLSDNPFKRRDSQPDSPSAGSHTGKCLPASIHRPVLKRDASSSLGANPFVQRDSGSSGDMTAASIKKPPPPMITDCAPAGGVRGNLFLKKESDPDGALAKQSPISSPETEGPAKPTSKADPMARRYPSQTQGAYNDCQDAEKSPSGRGHLWVVPEPKRSPSPQELEPASVDNTIQVHLPGEVFEPDVTAVFEDAPGLGSRELAKPTALEADPKTELTPAPAVPILDEFKFDQEEEPPEADHGKEGSESTISKGSVTTGEAVSKSATDNEGRSITPPTTAGASLPDNEHSASGRSTKARAVRPSRCRVS